MYTKISTSSDCPEICCLQSQSIFWTVWLHFETRSLNCSLIGFWRLGISRFVHFVRQLCQIQILPIKLIDPFCRHHLVSRRVFFHTCRKICWGQKCYKILTMCVRFKTPCHHSLEIKIVLPGFRYHQFHQRNIINPWSTIIPVGQSRSPTGAPKSSQPRSAPDLLVPRQTPSKCTEQDTSIKKCWNIKASKLTLKN